ncbi:hypothetical protein CC78DRAFT_574354 [Lojkania enalia]|uniref:Methyltransferase-domain-containing protein n=1 Tax=Lojkania enalia TaxID=147567 RepID=A0A9P4NBK4_9PLEO|nr:hypothetical protein CC78DRAFT_574354 [Didymosphaeria enalia]
MDSDPDALSKLSVLRRQYLQLVEPTQLFWPDAHILKAPSIQSWAFRCLFDVNNIPYLPPDRYRLRVLKLLISKLEESMKDPEEDVWFFLSCPRVLPSTRLPDILDDLMTALASLLSSNLPSESASAQQKAYVTYSYPLHSTNDRTFGEYTVTLLESRSVISSSGTTGLRTWEAALLLGAFLVSQQGRQIVQGKKIFELGAGTGMLSILCAKYLGVSGIVATDGDEAVVDAIKTNVFLNGQDTSDLSHPIVQTAALKWGWPVDGRSFAEDYGMEVPDVVLGADVTYDRSVIPSLVSTLREFMDLNSSLQVFIAATIRNDQTFETFQTACRRYGFKSELVDFAPVPRHVQDGPFYPTATPIQIWRISRPQRPRDLFPF